MLAEPTSPCEIPIDLTLLCWTAERRSTSPFQDKTSTTWPRGGNPHGVDARCSAGAHEPSMMSRPMVALCLDWPWTDFRSYAPERVVGRC